MTQPMRILQVIDSLGNGGAETLLLTLARSIDTERFELSIAALRPLDDSPLTASLAELGVPIHVIHQRASYDLPALVRLIQLVQRKKFEVIHTHLLGGDIMGRMAGFVTRRPVVSSVHSASKDFDVEPWRRRLLERWTARLWCHQIVVVSPAVVDDIARWYGVDRPHVVAIANAVDTERFRPGRSDAAARVRRELSDSDGPLVTTIARLTPQKGIDNLLSAAQLVLAQWPQVRFAVVGDGPLREELKERAAELGIAASVRFTGHRGCIQEILAGSDLYVLPSNYEGLPLALLEAMACACPSIATDVGGVRDVIQDGENGLLVPHANPQALADAIDRCLADGEWAARLGAAGRQTVERAFSARAWARKMESLYVRQAGRDPRPSTV